MQENQFVEIDTFVAWVNTLVSDGYNLYPLIEIYKRDYEKIKNNNEVKRNLEYLYNHKGKW